MRLACGGIWREQLVPVSGLKGKPVTYASYDPPGTKGLPPPAIQSSLDRSKPSDWKSVGEGLWATAEFSFEYWHAGETRDILFEGNICIRWLTGMHEAFFNIDGFKTLGFD